ncbi:DUF2516 family protein [Nocardioides sp. MH1]|uniref:DUF2516 family protein n=1 Tax=Nocardioides sp. MH1 TaxID=3242490 RepID=UPI00352128BB
MDVFVLEGWIYLAVFFLLLVIKIFAFANSLLYSAESYVAADRRNKTTWCAVLGVALLLQLAQLVLPLPLFFSIINFGMTIAALVYLADVRPALAGLRRR